MKKVFKKLILTGIMITSLFLSGCGNNRQLHERLIIQGVCLDKVNDEYILTLNIFDSDTPPTESDSKDGEQKTPNVMTCKGKSVSEAFSTITSMTGKQPMYSQNLVLIIGEESARHGVYSFIDFFVRHYESRPSIEVFVFKGLASNVMKNKINGKPITAKTIETLSKSSHYNMNVMGSNLVEFVSRMQSKTSSSSAAVLNINDEDELIAQGTAVFSGDKLTDFLDANETKGALLICKNIKGGTEVIDVPNIGTVTYTIMSANHKVFATVKDDTPEFDIVVNVQTNVYEINHPLNQDLPKDSLTLMEDKLSARLQDSINKSIKKCIVNKKCDIFNFGKRLMNSNPSYFKTIENKWEKIMTEAKYNVKVTSQINKTGQEVPSP